MSKIKDFFKSPHIQMSLATGASIIILAYFSKHVLPRPISYLANAFPPFLMVVWESVLGIKKESRLKTTWYWVTAIFASTALIIILYWI